MHWATTKKLSRKKPTVWKTREEEICSGENHKGKKSETHLHCKYFYTGKIDNVGVIVHFNPSKCFQFINKST